LFPELNNLNIKASPVFCAKLNEDECIFTDSRCAFLLAEAFLHTPYVPELGRFLTTKEAFLGGHINPKRDRLIYMKKSYEYVRKDPEVVRDSITDKNKRDYFNVCLERLRFNQFQSLVPENESPIYTLQHVIESESAMLTECFECAPWN